LDRATDYLAPILSGSGYPPVISTSLWRMRCLMRLPGLGRTLFRVRLHRTPALRQHGPHARSLRCPAAASSSAIFRKLLRFPVIGFARLSRLAMATTSGCFSACGLRPVQRGWPDRRLRSRAARSFFTRRVFSSCENTPTIWRIATRISSSLSVRYRTTARPHFFADYRESASGALQGVTRGIQRWTLARYASYSAPNVPCKVGSS